MTHTQTFSPPKGPTSRKVSAVHKQPSSLPKHQAITPAWSLAEHFVAEQKRKMLTLIAGGTITLYNRKTVRNFRQDGHDWGKDANGKPKKEGHEDLKVGLQTCLVLQAYVLLV